MPSHDVRALMSYRGKHRSNDRVHHLGRSYLQNMAIFILETQNDLFLNLVNPGNDFTVFPDTKLCVVSFSGYAL